MDIGGTWASFRSTPPWVQVLAWSGVALLGLGAVGAAAETNPGANEVEIVTDATTTTEAPTTTTTQRRVTTTTAAPTTTLPPTTAAPPPPPPPPTAPAVVVTQPPPPPPSPVQDCTPGYSPCIPPGDDVDCAGGSGNGPRYVDGPVSVQGSDIYDLDRDGDGVGCE